jgi:DNA-binding protein HU-beta
VNRRELVNAVASHTGKETKEIDTALRGFVDVVTVQVAKGENVVISGFAKFAKVKRAARVGRNPQTGEPVQIKASVKARITPLKGLKDVVSGAAPAPKLAKVAPAKAAPAKKRAVAKKTAASKRAAPAKKATAKKR